jgi:hypothetical protein
MSLVTMFPAVQYWFEAYRTISKIPYNQIVRTTQEIMFGSLIMSYRSNEADARRECYLLQEELESRIIGFMPNLGEEVEIVMPIVDEDAAFSQMEGTGIFALSAMWTLQWQITKGASNE